MKKFYFICGVSFLLALLISGCGPRHYISGDANKPGEVVASGYTQDGCLEELQEQPYEVIKSKYFVFKKTTISMF